MDLGPRPWTCVWWKGVLVCWVGSQGPRCPEMMVRGSCWLWLGFSSFGQLNFTGGSPGSGAPCLFSLHKDFCLGPPLWRSGYTSLPVVTPPGRKIHCPHVPSGASGPGPASGQLWRSWARTSAKLSRETGNTPSSPGQRNVANRYTRWAARDCHWIGGRKQQNVLCYPAPERATALGIWGDF